MKRIEIQGLGVFVELYRRNDRLTDLETIKEAIKTLGREVLKRELNTNNSIGSNGDGDIVSK